jgi:hypothetical protein
VLTYLYNKFRPVNYMHYIKCSVNISLLTYFLLRQKVCGTLDLCFITRHSIHSLQMHLDVIFPETRYHTQSNLKSGALIRCTIPLDVRRIQTAQQLGRRFCWPVFVMATL